MKRRFPLILLAIPLLTSALYGAVATPQPTNCDPALSSYCTTTDDRLWHLDRIDQDAVQPLDNKYGFCTTGAGVDVWVLDTGVMASHSEFNGNVTAGHDFSGDSAPSAADNPCGGFVGSLPADATVDNFGVLQYNRRLYELGHGTSVASLIAGQRTGVAKGARIIPLKAAPCRYAQASAWQSNHFYQVGDRVITNSTLFHLCTRAGTSGAQTPNWSFNPGAVIADNQALWTPDAAPKSPPVAWQASHTYQAGDHIVTGANLFHVCTQGGTSGSQAPNWTFTKGDVITDNQVQWTPDAPQRSQARMMADATTWMLQNRDVTRRAILTTSMAILTDWFRPTNDELAALATFEQNISTLLGQGVPVFASANNRNIDACGDSPARLSRGNPSKPTGTDARVMTIGGTMIINNPDAEVGGTHYDPNLETHEGRWLSNAGGDSNTLEPGSNFGPCVTMFAPAKNITSALIASSTSYRNRLEPQNQASGTSFSAPIAAAVAARYLELRSNATVDDVYNALTNTAVEGGLDTTAVSLNGSPNLVLRATDIFFDQQPAPVSVSPDSPTTLTVAVTAAGSPTFQWYQGSRGTTTQPLGTGASISVSPHTTTTYWVRVSSSCPADWGAFTADSRAAVVTVTIPPPAITTVTASATTTTINWTYGEDPNHFDIVRTGAGGVVTTFTATGTTRTLTQTVPANTAYSYKVCPVGGQTTTCSAIRIATAVGITDPGDLSNGFVRARHLVELRTGANALCTLVASCTAPYSGNALDENFVKTQRVQINDFTTVKTQLDSYRGTIGTQAATYRLPFSQNPAFIRGDHVEDLRSALNN
jgi:hypothetical protein